MAALVRLLALILRLARTAESSVQQGKQDICSALTYRRLLIFSIIAMLRYQIEMKYLLGNY